MNRPATVHDPAVQSIIDALGLQGRSVTKLVITLDSVNPLVQVEVTEETRESSLESIASILTHYEMRPK